MGDILYNFRIAELLSDKECCNSENIFNSTLQDFFLIYYYGCWKFDLS